MVTETVPVNIQGCFQELNGKVQQLVHREPFKIMPIELSLETTGGSVWLVKVQTKELPSNTVFNQIRQEVGQINTEEDFTFFLTFDYPQSRE